eukprot:jgi/Mesvir1/21482/Mv03932-RA.1
MSIFMDGCEEAYKEVFSDNNETSWCALGYDGQKLKPVAKGAGGLDELVATFEDGNIIYGLLRQIKTDDRGDSVRIKFIFLTWVGEAAPAMKKGKVTLHKPMVGSLFKGYHIEKQIYEREELNGLAEKLEQQLKVAAGANYDMGNRGVEVDTKAADYKNASKEFFSQKDKETQIKAHIYDKGPLPKEGTPVDLGGRAMTAGASIAKKNIVG